MTIGQQIAESRIKQDGDGRLVIDYVRLPVGAMQVEDWLPTVKAAVAKMIDEGARMEHPLHYGPPGEPTPIPVTFEPGKFEPM